MIGKLFRVSGKQGSSLYESLAACLFWLTKHDAFRHLDAVIGCLIFGSPGSGKSSASGKTLRDSYLTCDWAGHKGYGFLVLTAKVTETDSWRTAVKEAGRENDLIIVNEDNGWKCNLISYLLEKGETPEQVVKRIVKAVKSSAGTIDQQSGGAAEYFNKAFEQLLLNSITLLHAVDENVTFSNIYLLVRNVPLNPEKINFIKTATPESLRGASLEEQASISFFDACAIAAIDMLRNGNASYEVKEALQYFFSDYARMPETQRQAVYSTFTANIDPLARGIYNELFSNETNFTPEDSRKGGIIILDLPVNRYDYVGKFTQNFFKNIWLSDMMKEAPDDNTLICSVWMDEYQNFIEESDMVAFSQSREYLIAPVVITQNLPSLFARTNDKQSLARGISGSLVNKIFHANNDVDTNKWASEMIGYEMKEKYSYSANAAGGVPDFFNDMIFENPNPRTSSNISQSREYKLEPNFFNTLARGGHDYGGKVEAVFTSTRNFKATNTDWLLVQFRQG